jgi:hypothetical protein
MKPETFSKIKQEYGLLTMDELMLKRFRCSCCDQWSESGVWASWYGRQTEGGTLVKICRKCNKALTLSKFKGVRAFVRSLEKKSNSLAT